MELAVKFAKDTPIIDEVFVSTESAYYEMLARKAGAETLGLGPKKLAGDTTTSVSVVLDLLKRLNNPMVEYVVLLQPTSPIRTPEQIADCVRCSIETGESVVTVEQIEEPHPYKLKIINRGYLDPFLPGPSVGTMQTGTSSGL